MGKEINKANDIYNAANKKIDSERTDAENK